MLDSMAVQKILKEDTAITVEVSEEDVTLYAEQLGIDVLKEKHLLWIARKGLETPIPMPWCPVEDEKGRIYYYNRVTDKSTWEHPADEYFRKLVKQERDKHIVSKEDTELGIESELSSLDDVPPIGSGKNSISSQLDENNMKTTSRRMGSLSKLHELGKQEKYSNTSYLKSNVGENKFHSKSFISDAKSLGKRSNYTDPLIKVTDDNSLILNHSTDDDLSTGLDGIGFDRFAEQYGIMDASRLSPVMPSSQISKDRSHIKLPSEPMPKSLLKTLFNTSEEFDQSFSEGKKDEDLSFADFLKKAEEYSNKALTMDKSQSENFEEKFTENHLIKDTSNSSGTNISMKQELEPEMQANSLASDNEKFKHDIFAIEDHWKRKLEEREKEIRLDHEKYIAELQEKLAKEKSIEEKKLNDSLLLMKEENAVILAKQEQVLTEELEADLESAKEEIEMKRLATLQAIQDQEEKYTRELEEKKTDAKQVFESKVQELHLEMEKKLEERKQDIQHDHQQKIDELTQEHAKHLEELKKNFQITDNQELSTEVATLKEELTSLKDQVETEKQALEQLRETKLELEEHKEKSSKLLQEDNNLEHATEIATLKEELITLKEQVEAEKQALEQLQKEKLELEEQKDQLSKLLQDGDNLEHTTEVATLKEELTTLKEQVEAEKQALEQLWKEKVELEEQKDQLSKLLQEDNNLEVSTEIATLKEELVHLKEQIEIEKQAWEQLQEEKLELEDHKNQLSRALQEEEMIKHKNEEERDELLKAKCILQNEITELKTELIEQNQAVQCLVTNKCSLETEITSIKKELDKQMSLLQQTKQLPTVICLDKCIDTSDLLLIDDDVREKEKSMHVGETISNYEPEKESESADDHIACHGDGENEKIFEEEKMERLEIKIAALEKAFRLLETKIGNTLDSALLHDNTSHSLNNKLPETDEKCECYNRTSHSNFAPGISNTVEHLFSSDELKSPPYLQNTSNNKYSLFCMPNNVSDAQCYENNLTYRVYSKDLGQQEMNLALPPVYISESNTEIFSRSDTAIQLEQCKEKFRNLQAKHEISQLNLELIKKEIFNDMSKKDIDNNNEMQNLNHRQIPGQLFDAPQLESQYMENNLQDSALTKVIKFPTKNMQNDEWHSTLWQNAQKFIQQEPQFQGEEKENNPLDQFLALTETVLDKELELFSKDRVEKHYLSYPKLNERNFSNNFVESESVDKLNDSYKKNATYSGLRTNYKPMYIHQPTLLGDLITEKEDWMGKIGNMYQRIRAYERDLVLKRSLKTNV